MIKKISFISCLVLALASIPPGWAARAATQEAKAKDAIEIAFPSQEGDRARYAVTKIQTGDAGESNVTTDVTVVVTRADESGFLITWTYGKFLAGAPGQEADPQDQAIVDLTRSVRLLLQFDASGTEMKLANWKEIQGRLAQGLEKLQERMKAHGADQQETGSFASRINTFYQNPKVMTAYYTKEPTLFFTYLGKRIEAAQPVEYDMVFPNPFGGDPFPSRGRRTVKEYDPAGHRAVILATSTLDPSRMPKIMDKIARDLVGKFAPGQAGAMPKDMFKAFSMNTETEVTLDLASGWPEALTYKTSTTIELAVPGGESPMKVNRGESFSMTRIKDEGPPASPGAGSEWMALNNEAVDLSNNGDNARAVELGKKALALAEKKVGPDHLDVATSVNNLALIYDEQGLPAEAEPLYKRALAIWEKTIGPDHLDVASGLNNLALLYYDQDRYAEAEPLYTRALAIREKALGPDHSDVATSLNNLALLFYSQDRYAEAEPLYKRALAIWEQALGPDHPKVASCLNNLALLYRGQGRNADAELLYKRALAIKEKAFGPDHPNLATTLENLAKLYRDTDREKEAKKLEARAARIRSIKR